MSPGLLKKWKLRLGRRICSSVQWKKAKNVFQAAYLLTEGFVTIRFKMLTKESELKLKVI